jgi:hypothetical protein
MVPVQKLAASFMSIHSPSSGTWLYMRCTARVHQGWVAGLNQSG